jgi:hypothetical protein
VLAGGHLTFSGNPAQFKQVEKVSKIFWGDTKESKELSSLAGR